MPPFTTLELEQLWVAAGGSPDADAVAAAVALAESGGDPTRIDNTAYPARPGYHKPAAGAQPEYSVGIWQVNMLAHPSYTEAALLTPTGNAKAAIAISGNGKDWQPWSTYTSGAYLKFLPGAETAAGGASPGGSAADAGIAPTAHQGWAAFKYAVNTTLVHRAVRGRNTLQDARVILSRLPQ